MLDSKGLDQHSRRPAVQAEATLRCVRQHMPAAAGIATCPAIARQLEFEARQGQKGAQPWPGSSPGTIGHNTCQHLTDSWPGWSPRTARLRPRPARPGICMQRPPVLESRAPKCEPCVQNQDQHLHKGMGVKALPEMDATQTCAFEVEVRQGIA